MREAKKSDSPAPVPPAAPVDTPLLQQLNSTNVHFSGDAMESSKWWVLVTAVFDHIGWPVAGQVALAS